MNNKTKLSSMLNCMKIVKNFANDRQDYLHNLEYYSSQIEVEFSDFNDPNTVARVKVFTRSFMQDMGTDSHEDDIFIATVPLI